MVTVLYRKSSGEVLKISPHGQKFDEINGDLFGYLSDPDFPDGKYNREIKDEKLGPSRVKGFQKIAIPQENLVRNATQKEINSFDNYIREDEKVMDANAALNLFESHPRFRKVFKALSNALEEIENQMTQIESRVEDIETELNLQPGVLLQSLGKPKGKTHKKIKDMINKDD